MNIEKLLNRPMSLKEAKRVFDEWANLCFHNASDGYNDVDEDSVELYRAIRAAEKAFKRLEKLEAKNSPMKIKEIHCDEYICPACGEENNNRGELNPQDRYCPECGQRLEH